MEAPKIVTVPPMVVAVLSMTGAFAQIPGGYARLYEWVEERGLVPAGPPCAVYLTMPPDVPEEQAMWELWAPVEDTVAEAPVNEAGISIRHTEATEALSGTHVGPYDTISSTYEAMLRWAADHGYALAGPPMERYYSDPEEVPPEEYLTEVLLPVRPTR